MGERRAGEKRQRKTERDRNRQTKRVSRIVCVVGVKDSSVGLYLGHEPKRPHLEKVNPRAHKEQKVLNKTKQYAQGQPKSAVQITKSLSSKMNPDRQYLFPQPH